MAYFNNEVKLNDVSNSLRYSNGLVVSSLIPHWQFNPIKRNNELENIFVQEKVLGTFSRNPSVFSYTTTSEATVEGDTVIPINSDITVCQFTCKYEGAQSMNIGLGEVNLQGGATTVSGIFLTYNNGTLFFEFHELNSIVYSTGLNSWNGDNDAIEYVKNNISNLLTFQILWNKASRESMLFLVVNGVSTLLHKDKPITAISGYNYIANKAYSFTAYFRNGTLTLTHASLLVSPYTYLRETSINYGIMASQTTGAPNTIIPLVVIGTRSSDRQCVDILSYSARQSVARPSVVGIVEYKQHVPAILSTMTFGGYGTNLNVVAYQGTPPASIPINALNRHRHIAHLPNNIANNLHIEKVIKNVCRISGAYKAESTDLQRTYCALYYHFTVAGGALFGNITIAEY